MQASNIMTLDTCPIFHLLKVNNMFFCKVHSIWKDENLLAFSPLCKEFDWNAALHLYSIYSGKQKASEWQNGSLILGSVLLCSWIGQLRTGDKQRSKSSFSSHKYSGSLVD